MLYELAIHSGGGDEDDVEYREDHDGVDHSDNINDDDGVADD